MATTTKQMLNRSTGLASAPRPLLSSRAVCCSAAGARHVMPAAGAVHAARHQQHSISAASCALRPHRQQQQQQQHQRQQRPMLSSSRSLSRVIPHAEPENNQQGGSATSDSSSKVVYNTEFGYSRKDVLLIIVALIGAGVLMYEGLQAMGMDAGIAGNWVQLTIFLGICVGWVSTYLWRVANKKMTYARQLEMYESAVMQKRLEEMTEAELQQLMSEVEADKARLAAAKEAMQRQQQQQRQ